MKLLTLAFVALFCSQVLGQSYFAPGVVGRVPAGKEKTRGNNVRSGAECGQRGGEWSEGNNYAVCVLPYADAGKLCRNSKECMGHCIMPLNKASLDGKPLPKGRGICQLNDSSDDCGRFHFENGRIKTFKCD